MATIIHNNRILVIPDVELRPTEGEFAGASPDQFGTKWTKLCARVAAEGLDAPPTAMGEDPAQALHRCWMPEATRAVAGLPPRLLQNDPPPVFESPPPDPVFGVEDEEPIFDPPEPEEPVFVAPLIEPLDVVTLEPATTDNEPVFAPTGDGDDDSDPVFTARSESRRTHREARDAARAEAVAKAAAAQAAAEAASAEETAAQEAAEAQAAENEAEAARIAAEEAANVAAFAEAARIAAEDAAEDAADDLDDVVTGEFPAVPREPWEGYDALSVKMVRKHVRDTGPSKNELVAIRTYEASSKARASLLAELDERIERA